MKRTGLLENKSCRHQKRITVQALKSEKMIKLIAQGSKEFDYKRLIKDVYFMQSFDIKNSIISCFTIITKNHKELIQEALIIIIIMTSD